MSAPVLLFTAPVAPPAAPSDHFGKPGLSEHRSGPRPLTSQQRFFAAISKLYREFGAEVPKPELLGAWRKRLFPNSPEAMVCAIEELALSGALEKGPAYVFARLRNGIADGTFHPENILQERLPVDSKNLAGDATWNGYEWEPVGSRSGA